MPVRSLVVTGARGALGSTVVALAISRGWRVAGIDHAPANASPSDETLHIDGVDLSDATQANTALARIAEQFGRVDALANIAGGFAMEPLADGDAKAWNSMHRINLMTAVHASRAAIPHLLTSGSGRIVNMGAIGALKADAGMGPYASSKAGIHRLTEALAQELRGKVTVNAILPSTIDTPVNRKSMPDADFATWVTPTEIAEVILFLASEAASGVTGALIPVAGRV